MNRGEGDDTAVVRVAIPEKLFLLKGSILKGFHPLFIHVIDPSGVMLQYQYNNNGDLQYRAMNISNLKAICEANSFNPYLIFWTSKECVNYFETDLSKMMGVEGWKYADGRTIKTAGIVNMSETEIFSTQKISHWLDKYVHEAHVTQRKMVVVEGVNVEGSVQTVTEHAEIHEYPILNIKDVIIACKIESIRDSFTQVQHAICQAIQLQNRQVTVLLGVEDIRETLNDNMVYELLSPACEFTILIIAISFKPGKKFTINACNIKNPNLKRIFIPISVNIAKETK